MKREYPRGQEEFARVLAFSDGVYAITGSLITSSSRDCARSTRG